MAGAFSPEKAKYHREGCSPSQRQVHSVNRRGNPLWLPYAVAIIMIWVITLYSYNSDEHYGNRGKHGFRGNRDNQGNHKGLPLQENTQTNMPFWTQMMIPYKPACD